MVDDKSQNPSICKWASLHAPRFLHIANFPVRIPGHSMDGEPLIYSTHLAFVITIGKATSINQLLGRMLAIATADGLGSIGKQEWHPIPLRFRNGRNDVCYYKSSGEMVWFRWWQSCISKENCVP